MFRTFVETIIAPLLNQYGLSLSENVELNDWCQSITYANSKTRVKIVLDKGQVSTMIGPNEPQGAKIIWFDVNDVAKLKGIPGIKNLYSIKEYQKDAAVSLTKQLSQELRVLRESCEPLLAGDFTVRDAIEQMVKARINKLRLSMTRKQTDA